MFDMFTSKNVKKKIFKYPLSRPTTTTMSDQIVGLRECWLSNLSDILGGICPTWEYDRWYTWSVLYLINVPADNLDYFNTLQFPQEIKTPKPTVDKTKHHTI